MKTQALNQHSIFASEHQQNYCLIQRAQNQGLTSTRYPTIYKIDEFSKLSPTFRYENLCDKMINGIPAITQHNNYYMTERTHVSRHPCFGDDDGDNATFDMQNTKYTVPSYATCNPTRYPEFFPLPYPNPTRSEKALLVSLWLYPGSVVPLAMFGVKF